ncbi:MAG TPA: hydrogenase subunit MbhD domain-containing protein [Candidatus Binatia bacterium]|nr:hydrogenase subunit MbhD domain-containing protein [Candidatus Binatia bacterium]
MTFLQIGVLVLVALGGTILVFTRDAGAQPIVLSLFGLILALMFMIFQAPDVALSQIVVGAVGLPLMVLLAIAKLRRDEQFLKREKDRERKAQS